MMKGEDGRTHMRRGPRVIVAVVVIVIGLLSFLYISRFLMIRHLHAEIAAITHQERAALAVQTKLRARLAHANDPATIEYLARKELGLVKPGEEKIIFIKGN